MPVPCTRPRSLLDLVEALNDTPQQTELPLFKLNKFMIVVTHYLASQILPLRRAYSFDSSCYMLIVLLRMTHLSYLSTEIMICRIMKRQEIHNSTYRFGIH